MQLRVNRGGRLPALMKPLSEMLAKPPITPDEKLLAERALLSKPYESLSSDEKKTLYKDTRVLCRHYADDPQFSMEKLLEKFPYLGDVSFKT